MATTVSAILFILFGLVVGSAIPTAAVYGIVFVRRNGASWRTSRRLALRLLALVVLLFVLLGALVAASAAATGGFGVDSAGGENETILGLGGLALFVGLFGGIAAVVLAARAGRRERTSGASQRPSPPLSAG